MYGHKETAAILLENEARDDLHSAAARGDMDAIEELLTSGIDPACINRGGETALMWACTRQRNELTIDRLLKAKANVNAKDQHGFTALMEASQGGHIEAMKVLIAARADINAREPEDDQTALVMAMHCARSDAVSLLAAHGAEKPRERDVDKLQPEAPAR